MMASPIIITNKEDSIGGGDIKLMTCLAFCCGFECAAYTVLLGSVIALVYKVICKKSNNPIAFVPFLSIGYILYLGGNLNWR